MKPARGYRHWTTREDDELRLAWGHHNIAAIAKKLGRSRQAVYRRAGELGLGLGCPQGFEWFSAAAERTGFHRASLRRILQWANVPVRAALAKPTCRGVYHFVEPYAVDQAIAKWLRSETIRQAAYRIGMSEYTLRCWLIADIAAGLVTTKLRLVPGAHWHLMPEVWNAVAARHSRGNRETGRDAAKRIGVSWNTLRSWLRREGIARPSTNEWLLEPSLVDGVAARRRRPRRVQQDQPSQARVAA